MREVLHIDAHAARTFSADPLMSFKFRVNISGLPSSMGFKGVSGLSTEREVVTYFENMYEYPHKLPGRTSVNPITFTRGMYEDPTLQEAFEEVINNDSTRSDVTINICDRSGIIRRTFSVSDCWFSGYAVSDLSADSSDVIIETLTMQAECFV